MTEADGKTVLVVEDEALLLFTIADDLRAAGFRVFEATSAPAALRLLDTLGGIDVLFTDVDMPGGMNGLQLAQKVRDRWPAAAVLITSGHVNLGDGDLPRGGQFLAKPYIPASVISAIQIAAE
ncbi:MAG TPA: response regulator [Devosia sp.]|jgi:CheY-like chemotaxis protein|nr:response regulator [Devosia sp.]